MPQRTNQFQRLVALLNTTLAGQARVIESAMLKDKVTGEDREVDVLLSARAATYDVSIGIEVVSWSRPADTPWIEKMRAKHANLDIDRTILVSERGFTGPAVKKAQFYRIETLTIQEALATDWPLLSSLESSGVFELTTIKYTCSAVCQFEDGLVEQLDVPLNTLINVGGKAATLEFMIRTLMNKPEFREALYPHIKGAGEHEFWMSYTQPEKLGELQHGGRTASITELRIGLKVLRRESPVTLATGKYQSTPFLSGAATPEHPPLQFVLAKKPDGKVTGYLADADGLQSLVADSATGTQ
jgi:hypothetical protein